MGGEYVGVPADEEQAGGGTGYASVTSEDYDRRAAAMYAEQVREVDIVITNALIPGRPAPRPITEEMVAAMAPGSEIVDKGAAQGGNVAGSGPHGVGAPPDGVTHIG